MLWTLPVVYFDPWTVAAFLAGVGAGLILNRALRWAVDLRFRLANRHPGTRARSGVN